MRSSRSREWFAFATALCALPLSLVAGCASSPNALPSRALTADIDGTRGGSNHITAAELQSVNAPTTLDVVRRLRPEFLRVSARANPAADPSELSVYVDRSYVGDVSWLASIPIVRIRDIAFLHPAEARMQFGSGCHCDGGVLVVQTERTP